MLWERTIRFRKNHPESLKLEEQRGGESRRRKKAFHEIPSPMRPKDLRHETSWPIPQHSLQNPARLKTFKKNRTLSSTISKVRPRTCSCMPKNVRQDVQTQSHRIHSSCYRSERSFQFWPIFEIFAEIYGFQSTRCLALKKNRARHLFPLIYTMKYGLSRKKNSVSSNF